MPIKVAINGFGRIGRSLTKIIAKSKELELVAINDLADINSLANLLKYDSIQGQFKEIEIIETNYLKILDSKVKVLNESNLDKLNFSKYGAELIFECTGEFKTQADLKKHLKDGVKKVILSSPSNEILTFVTGVNLDSYRDEELISNGSCTSNAIAPILKLIEQKLSIESGFVTTIHSYTSEQNLLDSKNSSSDIRVSRSCALNIIPKSTIVTDTVEEIIPTLKGKLSGQSFRVPTQNGSIVELSLKIKNQIDLISLKSLLKDATESELKGIIDIDKDFKVSSDFTLNSHSSTIADDLTEVINGNLIRIFSWYDNEWGYSNRLAEMAKYIYKKG